MTYEELKNICRINEDSAWGAVHFSLVQDALAQGSSIDEAETYADTRALEILLAEALDTDGEQC